MVDLRVNWIKSVEDTWLGLHTVDLSHSHFDNLSGVYLIWHRGATPHYVRVGQGAIRDRLSSHRNDDEINTYQHLGLSVTWASVPTKQLNGVEAYLAAQCKPLVGERFPNVTPISVNLPTQE